MYELHLLNDDVAIVKGYPYVYIKSLRALVGADFHLGYELVLAEEQGYFLPQGQFDEILEELDKLFSCLDVKIFVINGDLKHKFSRRTRQETREVYSFMDFVNERVDECYVVRGNHDNFVRGIFQKYEKINFVEPGISIGDYYFTHGHILNDEVSVNILNKFSFIGHEHPALILHDDIGGKLKIPAFLYGKTKGGTPLVILPAVSPLMSGVEVNVVDQSEYLSPIIRELTDIENFVPYGVIRGRDVLTFPTIKMWKNVMEV
ncbi:MAG: metallophosphoesterase [Candidatus Njordarchaeia archaeon]